MQAFHNDPAVKAKYQSRLAAHRAAEELVQGTGFDGGKGCAVGCTLNNYDHARYPIELGLPEWLARLEDRIFEGLPQGKAEQFAEDFLAAIPVGADVSAVRGQLAILRHTRDLRRLESNNAPYAAEVRAAIEGVISWIRDGEKESAARSAAESAAESAARSAAESAAESAARSAAWSAAWSAAESAAWSARSAESAAWSGHFEWEAATLLRLLQECRA